MIPERKGKKEMVPGGAEQSKGARTGWGWDGALSPQGALAYPLTPTNFLLEHPSLGSVTSTCCFLLLYFDLFYVSVKYFWLTSSI